MEYIDLMSIILRKSDFVAKDQQQPAHPRSLVSAFDVRWEI